MHRTASVAAVLFLSFEPTLAQECSAALTPDSPVVEAIACIRELGQALAQARAEPAAPALPPNAVVAFAIPDPGDPDRDPCPDGWSRYARVNGRVIVGVGTHDPNLPAYKAFDVAGERDHVLTEAEMPAHYHAIAAESGDGDTGDQLTADNQAMRAAYPGAHDPWYIMRGKNEPATVGRSSIVGANQAYSTMPPFIALFYCKKD